MATQGGITGADSTSSHLLAPPLFVMLAVFSLCSAEEGAEQWFIQENMSPFTAETRRR